MNGAEAHLEQGSDGTMTVDGGGRYVRLVIMTSSELLDRIVVDPAICFGKPTIRGHRIWVSLVLGYLSEGWTPEQVVDEYPELDVDDVRACIAYGARLADVRFVDFDHVA